MHTTACEVVNKLLMNSDTSKDDIEQLCLVEVSKVLNDPLCYRMYMYS